MKFIFKHTDSSEIHISLTPFSPDTYNLFNKDTDMILYSKNYINSDRIIKGVKEISDNDIIVYYGNENDKLLSELCLRFLNKNKVNNHAYLDIHI
jgi:hypothetical protein